MQSYRPYATPTGATPQSLPSDIYPVERCEIRTYPASDLEIVLHGITRAKMTGELVINFSQGSPAGHVRWKTKI